MRSGPPRPRRRGQPQTAGDLMAQVIARLGGDDRGTEQRIFSAWPLAVGEVFAKRTRPEQVRGTTLFVRVESSVLAHELTLLRGEILLRLTRALGDGIVTDLRTRVGPLDA